MSAVDQITDHLKNNKVIGDDDLEPGDIITSATIVVKIERIEEEDPQIAVIHTGDYITSAGLLALAKHLSTMGIVDGDEE